jgi:hypothetical protein
MLLMKLNIDGHSYTFIPIRAFRAAHDLPPEFGVAMFEPKTYEGLGSVEGAGAELNGVRAALLAAIPSRVAPTDLLPTVEALMSLFKTQLYAVNNVVGLRPVEVDFAVAGFADVTQAFAYALVRARLGGDPPDFDTIYQAWLESSARVAYTVHEYTHNERVWQVQVVSHAYGRAGLIAESDGEIYYVADATIACPAEGFMAGLLREVCAGLAGN